MAAWMPDALLFDGVAEALNIPGSDLRLFGKPESFVKRRMGVALARGANVDEALARAKAVPPVSNRAGLICCKPRVDNQHACSSHKLHKNPPAFAAAINAPKTPHP